MILNGEYTVNVDPSNGINPDEANFTLDFFLVQHSSNVPNPNNALPFELIQQVREINQTVNGTRIQMSVNQT